MIRARLKDLDIKITELANYLQISRPTMYKFIELYDEGNRSEVGKPILQLFDYIEDNKLIAKKNVINYILNTMVSVSENDTPEVNGLFKTIKEYISYNPSSEKTQFIIKSINDSQYDIFIHYLIEVTSLLKKRKITEVDAKKIKAYKEIINIYSTIKED